VIFTSDVFILLFFPIVFALFWAIRDRWRQNAFIVLASYVFYGWWDYRFCALLWAASTVDYVVARFIDASQSDRTRRRLLLLSCVTNIGTLAVFKYSNFFLESAVAAIQAFDIPISTWSLGILLPLGISFHTFQTLSYVIDVYRKRMPACQEYVTYLAFISFFPQLVAGPIERASHMMPQYMRMRVFDPRLAKVGLQLLLWGFLKKVAIADNFASLADSVFDDPAGASQAKVAFGILAFSIQIYCDFSGYSDMARGLGFLFGFELMRNFEYPYFSSSLTEFWRRWHISLSSWFRDYVYIPLGGSRVSPFKRFRNVMVTFLVSGLWHGASWNFVLWGLIHGFLVWIESTFHRPPSPDSQPDRPSPFMTLTRMAATFLVVSLAWVPFRAETLAATVQVYRALLFGATGTPSPLNGTLTPKFALGLLCAFLLVEFLSRRRETPLSDLPAPTWIRWSAYTATLWAMLLLVPGKMPPFIYFQF